MSRTVMNVLAVELRPRRKRRGVIVMGSVAKGYVDDVCNKCFETSSLDTR
jgi:hypothetical protein